MDRNVKLNYSSTLDGSILKLTCKNEMFNTNMYADEQILNVTCHSNGNWIPDPAEFTCSSLILQLHYQVFFMVHLSSYSSGSI